MLSDKELEELATRIEDKMMERIYQEVGKSFLKKAVWLMIAFLISIGVITGMIKIPNIGG